MTLTLATEVSRKRQTLHMCTQTGSLYCFEMSSEMLNTIPQENYDFESFISGNSIVFKIEKHCRKTQSLRIIYQSLRNLCHLVEI